MPSLSNLMEDYRNWRGRQEWEQGKGWQDFFGGDPRAQEQFEKLSGFGTDAGGLVGMIKASHGSPHMFDKFDFSKIGTGEGAQAYGHGGYFAEGFDSPTAKQYQENVKDMASIQAINDRMKELSRVMSSDEIAGQYRKYKSDAGRNAADEYDALMEQRNAVRTDPGHLYNVELKWPDAAREASDPLGEHHLLDWDAQLRRQPGDILDLLQKSNLYTQNIPASRTDIDEAKKVFSENKTKENLDALHKLMNQGKSPTGAMFYRELQNIMGNEKASEQLRKAGIPGIRYLDQASRGAGAGTRNYVMFDDQFPNIVSRNGASLSDLLDTSYQSGHTAPGPDFGAQLHDLTGGGQMYPDDIYSANAARFYGHGGSHEAIDKKAMSLVQMLRNQPDALVDIYRAVPKDESISSINPGDWVTITKEYAKEHGEGPLGGDYKILKQKVPAKSIWTNADSIHEYGYWPDR